MRHPTHRDGGGQGPRRCHHGQPADACGRCADHADRDLESRCHTCGCTLYGDEAAERRYGCEYCGGCGPCDACRDFWQGCR